MDGLQPEASSSTAPPPPLHQATFVFDSGLTRERYSELIESNGVVHRLVLRLMEKCGGETSVSSPALPSPDGADLVLVLLRCRSTTCWTSKLTNVPAPHRPRYYCPRCSLSQPARTAFHHSSVQARLSTPLSLSHFAPCPGRTLYPTRGTQQAKTWCPVIRHLGH